MSVLVLTTGGTIDKLYFDALSEFKDERKKKAQGAVHWNI